MKFWKLLPWIILGLCGPSIVRVLWGVLHLQAIGDVIGGLFGWRAMRGGMLPSQIDCVVFLQWAVWGSLLLLVNWVLSWWFNATQGVGHDMWNKVTKPWALAPLIWSFVWFLALPLVWEFLCWTTTYLPDSLYHPGHVAYQWIASHIGPLWEQFWTWLGHFIDELVRVAKH